MSVSNENATAQKDALQFNANAISNKNMDETQESKENLTTFIRDLFHYDEYIEWRKNLKNIEPCKWHSLIASLAKYDSPLGRIKSFDELIYSKLVFSYIEAPDYNESQMLMVQFTVSGGMWSSLIWHCPERN